MSLHFKKFLSSPFYLTLTAFLFILLGVPVNSFAAQVKLTLESYAPAKFPKVSKVIDVSNPNNQVEITKQAARFAHSPEGWNLQGFGGDVQDRYPPDWTGHFSFVHKISTSAENLFGYAWDAESTRYGGGYALYFHTDENAYRPGHNICQNKYGVISGGLDGAYSRCAVSNWGSFKVEQIDNVKIPLGKKDVSCTDKDKTYRIYIPSRYGGTLTVSTDAGVIELLYPNSSTKIAGPQGSIRYTVPLDKHGWYYVKYSGVDSCKITNTFEEEGSVPEGKRPWNFWFYPFNRAQNPLKNFYGSGGILEKYDAIFGTAAKVYEEQNYSYSSRDWGGHCWGGSIASILLSLPPEQLPYGDKIFSQEEIKGLETKLADTKAKNVTVLVKNIPAVRPKLGPDDTDKFVIEFHKGLLNLRAKEMGARKPIQSNLRDSQGNDPDAIWNHAIYKYISTLEESEEGNENIIRFTTTTYANNDTIFPSNNTKDRTDTYVYKLKYSDGEINTKFTNADWVSATGFAPGWLYVIGRSEFDGKGIFYNPEVKKSNAEKLGISFPN